ncbi:hypothetical protein KY289_028569 [Solanum tuberosum]|nr:hypothetical protein KY289_028569 [Solanum tuberosum]
MSTYVHPNLFSLVGFFRPKDASRSTLIAASCLIRGWRGLEGSHVMTREDGWAGSIYGRLGMRATSSLTTKLWAIHGGLILAKKYDLKKVIIETDSSEALKWLCLRQENNCADQLATLGRIQ